MSLQRAGYDEAAAQAVIGHNYAQRTRLAGQRRRDLVKEMHPKIEGTKSRASIYYAQNKSKIAAAARERKQFVQDLSHVVESHSTQRLSAMKIVKLAEETLRNKYPDRNVFVIGLKKYLKENKYSSDESAMARGNRAMQRDKIGQNLRREKRKASGASLSSSTSSKQIRLMEGDRRSLTSIASTSLPHQSVLKATDDFNELESQAWWDDGYFDN